MMSGPVSYTHLDVYKRQGYDEVWGDAAGNVYGRIHGADRALPALVLNTHLDHVDPGDPSLWPTPPFAAEIVCLLYTSRCV